MGVRTSLMITVKKMRLKSQIAYISQMLIEMTKFLTFTLSHNLNEPEPFHPVTHAIDQQDSGPAPV